MKIHEISLAVIFVSMIILGTITYIDALGEKYGTTADFSGLSNTSARLDEQKRFMNETYAEIAGIELSLNPIDLLSIPYKMIRVGWGSIKIVFGSWTVVGAIFSDLSSGLADSGIQLPDWLISSVVAILLLTIIAICVYAFYKWKFED